MKYRLISGLILAFFLVTEFSHGQDLTVEEYWMNCVYSSYEDEGAAIRSTLLNFENLLIEEGVLKNNKAASYKKLLEKMAEGQIEQTDSRSSMIKELVAVEKNADNSLLFSCQGSLKEHPDHSAVIQSKDDMITKLITEDKSFIYNQRNISKPFYQFKVIIGS